MDHLRNIFGLIFFLIRNLKFGYDQTGCLNGGGQIKPKPGQSAKELIQLLEAAYMENVSVFGILEVFQMTFCARF